MIDLTNQISGLNLKMYCADIYRDGYYDHYYAIEAPISRKMVGCFKSLLVAYKKSAPKL